jgi:hypothetical protein
MREKSDERRDHFMNEISLKVCCIICFRSTISTDSVSSRMNFFDFCERWAEPGRITCYALNNLRMGATYRVGYWSMTSYNDTALGKLLVWLIASNGLSEE